LFKQQGGIGMILKKTKKLFLFCALVVLFALPAEAKLSEQDAIDVWGRVAKATELTKIPFTIKSDDKTPNAWVTNGQSVTVTTGLLNLLDKQSELYGVLAHESGHAKLGHHEKTVTKATGLSLASMLLERLFGSSLGGAVASTAVNVGANLAYAGWSREQEVEADDYAVRLAHENGEDIVGLYSAMQKLAANGNRTDPSGFNTHPPDERRLLHIKNEILKIDPNAKIPNAPTETTATKPAETAQKAPVNKKEDAPPVVKPKVTEPKKETPPTKEEHYDIDAALERMRKEVAAEKAAAEKAAAEKNKKK